MIINEGVKKHRKYSVIAVIMPSIITFIVLYNKYSLNMALFSMIYALLVLILMYNTKDTIMEYNSVKNIGKLSIGIVLITSIATVFFVRNELFEDLIKYILMLMISNVILLRETRCYSHNLNDKKMRIMNIGIGIFFFAILSEKVENLFKEGLSIIYDILSAILVKAAIIFVTLTQGFWEFLWRLFKSSGVTEEMAKNIEQKGMERAKYQDLTKNEYVKKVIEEPSKLTVDVIQIIILCIIIFIAYKLIKKYIVGGSSKNQDEIREKIKVVKDKKENKFLKSIKHFMDGEGSIRDQIYYVFRSFQNKAYSTELYKQGMTASELNNETKSRIKDKESEIDNITQIYNEAKFSNHIMEKEHLETIVNGYKEIKGKL